MPAQRPPEFAAPVPKHLPPSKFFPPVEQSSPDGFLGVGGQLSPDWLLDAYRHGIFPWPVVDRREVLAWWSLNPRAIIELDGFHCPRRLARTYRSGRFRLSRDADFRGVIEGCARARRADGGTWITPSMIAAYVRLFELGFAHSVEAWDGERLAGGVYGVAIGGMFAGESMFHVVRDASKVALVYLVEHLRQRGYTLFDIQQRTDHCAQFGATLIPREEYLRRLAGAIDRPVTFGC